MSDVFTRMWLGEPGVAVARALTADGHRVIATDSLCALPDEPPALTVDIKDDAGNVVAQGVFAMYPVGTRTCNRARCSEPFTPVRLNEWFCSARCANLDYRAHRRALDEAAKRAQAAEPDKTGPQADHPRAGLRTVDPSEVLNAATEGDG